MAKELNNFRLHMFESGIRKVVPMDDLSFDCQPQDLEFEYYKLGVIENDVADELAARILRLIQDAKRWVGIYWDTLALLMYSDLVNERKENHSIKTVFKLKEYSADEDGQLMATAMNYLEENGFVQVGEIDSCFSPGEKEYFVLPTEKLVSLVPRK